MTLQLNIFTNATNSAPNTDMIWRTYNSFCDTFGTELATVYIDPNPNKQEAERYMEKLLVLFDHVYKTESLADGYIRSIKNSDADYLFQCEHDWTFNKDLIKHSLNQITDVMRENGIYHFRFNKRSNIVAGWDTEMKAVKNKTLPYCITNNLSNNPHIIDRKKYADEIIKHIKPMRGSLGIEKELNNTGLYYSAIYGGAGYPATVVHLDGRRGRV